MKGNPLKEIGIYLSFIIMSYLIPFIFYFGPAGSLLNKFWSFACEPEVRMCGFIELTLLIFFYGLNRNF